MVSRVVLLDAGPLGLATNQVGIKAVRSRFRRSLHKRMDIFGEDTLKIVDVTAGGQT